MKMVKSLLLGSAASIAAIAGAQAADLPVKAKPVEYVKVCSAYGAGYYYIPGTQTCIRIGGFLRMNVGIGSVAAYVPTLSGATPYQQRDRAFVSTNSRLASQIDIRSNTDYGVLRTYTYAYFNVGSYAGQSTTILTAYSQLAGFTVGKFKSSFNAPWSVGGSGYLGVYRPDDASSSQGIEYKWELGGGLSTAVGVFDPRRLGIFDRADTMAVGAYASSQAALGVLNSGYHMPDVQANVRLEQAWGGFHVGVKVQEVAAVYNGTNAAAPGNWETTGAPKTKYGFAANASVNIKNLPTGAGDQLWATVAYGKGSMNSLFSSTPAGSGALFGPGRGAAYNTVAFTYLMDGAFDSNPNPFGANTIQLTEGWSATLLYEHWWLPAKLKSGFYGNYAVVNYNDTATAIICTNNTGGSRFGFTAGFVCNPDLKYFIVGSNSTWYVARDFEITVDVSYAKYDTASSGTMTGVGVMPAGKPTGAGFLYEIKDQSALAGTVNILRTW